MNRSDHSPSLSPEFMVPLAPTDAEPRREICVRQQGSGTDVLLIAGLGAGLDIWADLHTQLSARYRVTAFDNQGVGLSLRGPGELTIPRFAEDTSRLCEALGITPAHVVGSSMGATIAQELAIYDPGSVASLTLIGSWAGPDLHLQRLLRHLSRLSETVNDPTDLARAFALWEYSGEAHASGLADTQIRRALTSTRPAQSWADYEAMTHAAIAHDARDRLARVRSPTLVLVGGEDKVCPQRLSRELHELISNATLSVLPGLGHLPFIEQPEAVAGCLGTFWASCS